MLQLLKVILLEVVSPHFQLAVENGATVRIIDAIEQSEIKLVVRVKRVTNNLCVA